MITQPHSLDVEATDDPTFFEFFSPELEAFSGVDHSLEDCLYQAQRGMREQVELLRETGLPILPESTDPVITVRNEPNWLRYDFCLRGLP